MKALLAIAAVAFFQLIYFHAPRGEGIVGYYMIEAPLLGLLLGVFFAMMSGPCFGKQTPLKRRFSLIGVIILLFFWFMILLKSELRGLTFASSLPFLIASLPLLVLRLRENPEKEDAERKTRLREEQERLEQIRSSLARK